MLQGRATQVGRQATIIFTDHSNFNPNPNPDISKHQVHTNCNQYLPFHNLISLKTPILYHQTHRHLHHILFFIKPRL
ncbi:agmatine deiminase family protein, partial [Siminovitchia fortis]|uniref:agmatine deiminase family protein n=1 Tax=Siminovitchia fortis TaxID=254758 RepID=UPI0036F1CF5D